jgi:hypothetical protein
MTTDFFARRAFYKARIELHGVSGSQVAQPVTFAEVDPSEHQPPMLSLTPEAAQSLADALYDAGIRPTGAAGSAGQLAAVQYHLQDMRALVFKEGKKP